MIRSPRSRMSRTYFSGSRASTGSMSTSFFRPHFGPSVASAACRSAGTEPLGSCSSIFSAAGSGELMSPSTTRPQTFSNGYLPTRSSMSTPRDRRVPPSLSGSAISVSNAITPSSPGRKSFVLTDGTLADRRSASVRERCGGRETGDPEAPRRLRKAYELREEPARGRGVDAVAEALLGTRIVTVRGNRDDRRPEELGAAGVAVAHAAVAERRAQLRLRRALNVGHAPTTREVEREARVWLVGGWLIRPVA